MFELPKHTSINRVVPKNSFDNYANPKHKRLIGEVVERIKWVNKLSKETINLEGVNILEIQIFEIELRKKDKIETLLDLIDRAIPYHLIFILKYQNECMLSASHKHPSPSNENQSIIDWSFRSPWFSVNLNQFELVLKGSLDEVFNNLCFQLAGRKEPNIDQLIKYETELKRMKAEIQRLESAIKTAKQFNEKVALNVMLQKLQIELKDLK